MAGMAGLPPSAASLPPRLDMPPSVSLGNHLSGGPRPDHAAAAAAAASMAAAAAASQGGPQSQAAAAAAAAANSASNGPKSEVYIYFFKCKPLYINLLIPKKSWGNL